MARYGSSDRPGTPGDEPTRSIDHRGSAHHSPDQPPFQPAPAGSPHHPASAPTERVGDGGLELRPPTPAEPSDFVGPPRPPWFRRRSVLIAWFGLILTMIALVIWGIIQITSRGPTGTTVPSTKSSTKASTTTTTTITTTPVTTTNGIAPRPSNAPPPAATPPAPMPGGPGEEPPPRHRPHLPSLPSVITIPPIPRHPDVPTVITLPPGF